MQKTNALMKQERQIEMAVHSQIGIMMVSLMGKMSARIRLDLRQQMVVRTVMAME